MVQTLPDRNAPRTAFLLIGLPIRQADEQEPSPISCTSLIVDVTARDFDLRKLMLMKRTVTKRDVRSEEMIYR